MRPSILLFSNCTTHGVVDGVWERNTITPYNIYTTLPVAHLFYSCRLLSEGPRLSSSVPSVVQPDATKQPPTSVAEVSQPPPYHHPPYHHPPSHPAPPTSSGLLSSSPQQSLYGAATSDYTIQQGHPPPHLSGPGHMTSHPGPVPMASLTSSQPPWSHGQQQPSLSVYSGTSFPQQRYIYPFCLLPSSYI